MPPECIEGGSCRADCPWPKILEGERARRMDVVRAQVAAPEVDVIGAYVKGREEAQRIVCPKPQA